MTPIEHLQDRLKNRFPKCGFVLDRPKNPNGAWFLDIFNPFGKTAGVNGIRLVVSFKKPADTNKPTQVTEFGLSIISPPCSEPAYDESFEEIYPNELSVFNRIVCLFTARPIKEFYIVEAKGNVIVGRNGDCEIRVGDEFNKAVLYGPAGFVQIEKIRQVNFKIKSISAYGKEFDNISSGTTAAITVEGSGGLESGWILESRPLEEGAMIT